MYKDYMENEQLNFQINRFMEPYYDNQKIQKEIKKACETIHNLEDWYDVWFNLGNSHQKTKEFTLASSYYQLAIFYLEETDPRKEHTYQLFKKTFYQSINQAELITTQVPYQHAFLPVTIIKRNKAKKWLVFHGGFDSYLEELVRLSQTYFNELKDYNILMFEGPGQGAVLQNKIYMTYKWEEPLKAILDYFQLDEVALLGMSLGGFLALKAAAAESRVKKVIAFDVFYSMMDAFTMKAPQTLQTLPDLTTKANQKLVDKQLEEYSKTNIDLYFKLSKAKEMLGKATSSDVLIELANYTLENITDKIYQDVLLLAGNEDMYVPTSTISFLQNQLINARQIESVLFTNKSGGQYHCQVGNKKVAFDKIIQFLTKN